ncbi:response regulator [Umezawaea tangerina]|nr:response regulator [Umezawaea tangerina]
MIDVLLVEDDPGDALMTVEAFEYYKVANRLHVVRDGIQAMDYLHRRGEYADAERPGLVLLDLDLPRMDGHEVLDLIKSDEDLRTIPVVMLTTSTADEDILRAYHRHANAYVVKPVDFDAFVGAVRQIEDFFISVVAKPSPTQLV